MKVSKHLPIMARQMLIRGHENKNVDEAIQWAKNRYPQFFKKGATNAKVANARSSKSR